jgi:5-(carboxyamino)imidazole ribonucleotide synthase
MSYSASPLPLGSTIGIIGGGQLGRMLAMSVAQMGYHAHIFTPEPDSPAAEVAKFCTVAEYDDEVALHAFAANVAVITNEFENIPASAAELLATLKPVYPSPHLFALCQHRLKEKTFINTYGGRTADYAPARSLHELKEAVQKIGVPCIAKRTYGGYDGKGQARIHDIQECEAVWNMLAGELVVEAFVPYVKEASIIVARSQTGEMTSFPIAENIHEGGILRRSVVPANVAQSVQEEMQRIGYALAEAGALVGILAIECFILEDGQVLVNELAARPHNTGHYSMDGCNISQFEMLVRICAGLPLVQAVLLYPTEMYNLLGEEVLHLDGYLNNPHARLHLYGKKDCVAGRKMAHVNVVHPVIPT